MDGGTSQQLAGILRAPRVGAAHRLCPSLSLLALALQRFPAVLTQIKTSS